MALPYDSPGGVIFRAKERRTLLLGTLGGDEFRPRQRYSLDFLADCPMIGGRGPRLRVINGAEWSMVDIREFG